MHPKALDVLKTHLVIFKHDVFPAMYLWTLHGVVTLLEQIWQHESRQLTENPQAEPQFHVIEFASILERLTAYGTTGNPRVLSRSIMKNLHILPSILHYGYPSIRSTAWNWNGHHNYPLQVHKPSWPVLTESRDPAISSKKAIILTYGDKLFLVRRI
jgi:hypothetical protein